MADGWKSKKYAMNFIKKIGKLLESPQEFIFMPFF